MHDRGANAPRFKYPVKLNLIISYVIIAYPPPIVCQELFTHIFFRDYRGGPTPPPGGPTMSGIGAGPPLSEGSQAWSEWNGSRRGHPLKQKNRGPKFTLYCLIQTVMVLVL